LKCSCSAARTPLSIRSWRSFAVKASPTCVTTGMAARLVAAIDVIRLVGGVLGVLLTWRHARSPTWCARACMRGRRARHHGVGRAPRASEGRLSWRAPCRRLGRAGSSCGPVWSPGASRPLPRALASAINLSAVQFLSVELCLILVAGWWSAIGGLIAAQPPRKLTQRPGTEQHYTGNCHRQFLPRTHGTRR
jgi:hypothetical protein